MNPGDVIIVPAPDYWCGSQVLHCQLTICQEKEGLKRFKYILERSDKQAFTFFHGAVNDCADGDLVEYLKKDIYHERWIVQ